MLRFLRVTLMVWLALVALIGGVIVYGRAHAAPNELQALGFDVCEGRPCFMGIVPGFAWEKLYRMPGIRHSENPRLMGFGVEGVGAYKSEKEPETVLSIYLVPSRLKFNLTMRQVVQLYGLPCYVSVTGEFPNIIWLYYDFMTISVLTKDGYWGPDTVVSDLLLDQDQCYPQQAFPNHIYSEWIGFASPSQILKHGKY